MIEPNKENENLWKFERNEFLAKVEDLGMTHEDLAHMLNISISTYKSALQPSRPFPKWARAFMLGSIYTVAKVKRLMN